mmetsp:Transcript_3516/g.9674  ORF Transcript_3516/g.9674 Transcript_3516/m.9674 type:complete len:437 (-) Transcript_3516:842-2152(-)|eukprot:CAMPEP_0185831474 /NCGR_PEP_ID=MMETSP1353-20130828/1503_1 /TAXON_ID=1077150 /ORGANISM="Erythrolobus australicus, Strain CCMP3124" /LENGTH=436 /DNA_ID=CAMNT_0028529531 /DNA_START=43 /DNA_END=1353 /DNA_ORIENTATION=-
MSEMRKGRTIRVNPNSNLTLRKEGFLSKRGNRLHMLKVRRFFRLDGTHLCNFRNPDDEEPTWDHSLLRCTVEPGKTNTEVIIRLPARTLELYADTEAERDEWVDVFTQSSNMFLENFYELGETIGRGQFGVVRMARRKDGGEKVAIKSFRKKQLTEEDYKYLKTEIEIVTRVNHPNVVSTYEVFESEESIMIVMEYLAGGMLYDIIAEKGTLTEQEASTVMLEILEGVTYLHKEGIVHRDLKPENMLCMRRIWPWRVKLCDFGLANFADKAKSANGKDASMDTQVGTPYFAAPEVVQGAKYDASVDIWSCGVILYTLLSGQFPFDDLEHPENTFRLIVKAQVKFPDETWKNVSDEAKDLVLKLLQKDAKARPTPAQAKQHPWIVSGGARHTKVIKNDMSMIQSSMRNFKETMKKKPQIVIDDEENETNIAAALTAT